MATTCNAIAKSTDRPCRHRSLPGSRYCLFHVEHLPLLYGALLGAMLGLGLSIAWSHFVPSRESQQLEVATAERDRLRKLLEQEQERAAKRSEEHSAQLARLEARLEPFMELASERFPTLPPDDALAELREDLREVREMASPPTISLARAEASPEDPSTVTLYFTKSKREPLGTVGFRVLLPRGGKARLKELSPAQLAMDVRYGIAPDGLSGELSYSVPGSSAPIVELRFSEPTGFSIEGSHGLGRVAVTPE